MNIVKFEQAIDYIKANPDKFDQDKYICNSAYCLAGHVVVLTDGMPMQHDTVSYYDGEECISIHDRARAILEISKDEADDLFDSDNRLNNLEKIGSEIARKQNEDNEMLCIECLIDEE